MKAWTPDEISIVSKYCLVTPPWEFSYDDICKKVNRSRNAVSLFIHRNKLREDSKARHLHIKKCISCGLVKGEGQFRLKKRRGKMSRIGRCNTCEKEYYKQQDEKYRQRRIERWADPELRKHDLNKQKEYKEKNINKVIIMTSRKRAKDKGLDFNLEESDIMVPKKCPLLGIDIRFDGTKNNRDSSPSLDRIDSSKGYIKGNVWIISYRANRIKNNATIEEIEMIAKNLKKMIRPPISVKSSTRKKKPKAGQKKR
jgi:hypothetical protein